MREEDYDPWSENGGHEYEAAMRAWRAKRPVRPVRFTAWTFTLHVLRLWGHSAFEPESTEEKLERMAW